MLKIESEFGTATEQLRSKRGGETQAQEDRYRTRKTEIENRLGAELKGASTASGVMSGGNRVSPLATLAWCLRLVPSWCANVPRVKR